MLDPAGYILTKYELLVENLTHQIENHEKMAQLLEQQIEDCHHIEAIYERQSKQDREFIVLQCEAIIRILQEPTTEPERAQLISKSQYIIDKLANKTNTGKSIN